jgi:hypothetical protein
MQIKTIMSNHLALVRVAIFKKIKDIKGCQECGEKGTLDFVGGNIH